MCFVVLTGTQCKSLWIRSTHAGHFQFSIFNLPIHLEKRICAARTGELTMCEHNGWTLVCRNRKAAILNNNRLRLHNLRVCLNCAVSFTTVPALGVTLDSHTHQSYEWNNDDNPLLCILKMCKCAKWFFYHFIRENKLLYFSSFST